MRRALLVAVLVVLAGCGSSVGFGVFDSTDDPDGDRLGWENGYWHDESVDVTPGDGYNASEREAAVARAMARVERIRGLEFNETVPVDVISREQYLRNRSTGPANETHNRWNNQVWEGLFLVGERTDVAETLNSTLGASVQGYYAPGDGEIVIVSDSPTPTIDRGTLAHELVHALQDQHFGLGGSPDTQDRQLATDGVIEGDANYVQRRYGERCDEEWDCLPRPQRGGGATPDGYNRDLFLTIFQPYATGPTFVEAIRDRAGWDGVNDLYSSFPDSTEQTIHPDTYPDEAPVDVTVADRSSAEWSRFDHDPVADTVGEASIFVMFVANDAVPVRGGSVYRYDSEASAGWGGDALVPYRSDGEYGYVWKTVWDTEADAEEFLDAYRNVLQGRNADTRGEGVYVVPESDAFGDAFRVTRDGRTVRIVNAPTVSELDGVHAA